MNAAVTGGLALGFCKGYTTLRGSECPLDIQIQTAGVLGASKLLVEQALPPDALTRAIATGSVFAGGMFGFFQDKQWMRWVALGTAASYIADVLLPPPVPQSE